MQRVQVSAHQAPVQKLGDSRFTLSPKFRLAAWQSSSLLNQTSESEFSPCIEPLIPGLPDDIALLRVPVASHSSCRAVCKSWHLLLVSKERFFSQRKELGFQDPWLFIFTFHKCSGKIQWKVLDLTSFSWHTIPPMPSKDRECPHGLRCISIPLEGTLFVCGGINSDMDFVMNRMLTARSTFASGVIDGFVYVAGGNCADLLELNSAEVLDPNDGQWRSIANMGAHMASYDATVLNGKLLVTEGWLWPFLFSPRGQVYDPKSDSSGVVVDGHLFVVSEHERMKLKVYVMETDSWETVPGAPVPEQLCKPFPVNSTGGLIYIVGRDLHVAIGHLRRLREKTNQKFFVQWQVVDAPKDFCDLKPLSSQVLMA
ncbi:hypothetical protein MKX01_003721 [Papaver californicum]|nr:hypothetical protein MKX01_003721 [Papaver californicum]